MTRSTTFDNISWAQLYSLIGESAVLMRKGVLVLLNSLYE